jgi:hypothetical protein
MEDALLILRVLIQHGCLPDVDVATTLAQTWFSDAGLGRDECLLWLATAAHNHWLISRNPGTIRMTDAGLKAATGSLH